MLPSYLCSIVVRFKDVMYNNIQSSFTLFLFFLQNRPLDIASAISSCWQQPADLGWELMTFGYSVSCDWLSISLTSSSRLDDSLLKGPLENRTNKCVLQCILPSRPLMANVIAEVTSVILQVVSSWLVVDTLFLFINLKTSDSHGEEKKWRQSFMASSEFTLHPLQYYTCRSQHSHLTGVTTLTTILAKPERNLLVQFP